MNHCGADELARTAAECLATGAAVIHVHLRDSEDRHLLDAASHGGAIRTIRAKVGARLAIVNSVAPRCGP